MSSYLLVKATPVLQREHQHSLFLTLTVTFPVIGHEMFDHPDLKGGGAINLAGGEADDTIVQAKKPMLLMMIPMKKEKMTQSRGYLGQEGGRAR
jgi:hypothetical protein